ncbi:D-amino-acid transaminase [Paenibacillus sp. FSL H7-0331]|uniref:D-amino-acid transaminase n=1 Tax=Paenibacillus sp. FSL H7-0331 TaxID=1920421 RepID=UPI00096E841A|nr:D-amino-acid transaminase [Paenibacillus sp. FSL H7-0331]OMF19653.1 D-amino-acid transaminase [Paenibacillus sp. FSL H7-0331]
MYLYQHQFVPKEEVAISPDDRGYYFGDGIYEVFRVYNGELFEAEGHYRRLEKSAADVRICLPYSIKELHERLIELIQLNHLQEGTVYIQVTRGSALRSHPFPSQPEPVLMAFTTEMQRPIHKMDQGITAVTADDIRWLRCDLKTLNLLPNVMAKQDALDRGADDVIWHRNGTITECSASNFMLIKNGELWTHPANNLILHGITRDVVLKLARQLQLEVHETPFLLDELKLAEEAFITGTTVEITPVISIDNVPIAQGFPGPITRQLQQAFRKHIGLA